MGSLIQFKDIAGNPRVWQEVAHDLVCSANILLDTLRGQEGRKAGTDSPRPAVWRTTMMLYGLAAENLIKAIIMAKKPVDVKTWLSEGSFPDWLTKGHNLPELARRAGLPVPRSQEHLLKRLNPHYS